jgi:uncharacterized membrane protein YsdA (DUF1294 family)
VVCAGRALTLALALMLALLLAGMRQLLPAWLAGISVATLAAYGYDKVAARGARLRVPERVLLGLALVGGTPGALAAMVLFHHKTRKRSFLLRFLLIVGAQLGVLLAWRPWVLQP